MGKTPSAPPEADRGRRKKDTMLTGTNLLIAGIACIGGGVALIIWGDGDTANLFAGVLITGGVSLWGVKPVMDAAKKRGP